MSPANVDYTGMITTLNLWSKQCDLVLSEIAGRIRDIKTTVATKKATEDEYEKELENAKRVAAGKKSLKATKSATSGTQHAQDFDPENEVMQDIEEQEGGASPRGAMSERGSGGGGESPKARKRKLVLTPT